MLDLAVCFDQVLLESYLRLQVIPLLKLHSGDRIVLVEHWALAGCWAVSRALGFVPLLLYLSVVLHPTGGTRVRPGDVCMVKGYCGGEENYLPVGIVAALMLLHVTLGPKSLTTAKRTDEWL